MTTLLAKWDEREVGYAKLNAQGRAMLRMIHAVATGATWQQQQQFARYAADLMACFATEADYLNYIEERERPKPAVKAVPVPRPTPQPTPTPRPPPPDRPTPRPQPPAKPLNKGMADIDSMSPEELLEFVRNNPHLVGSHR